MVRLSQLEKAMKGQFIWDRSGKLLQTSETYEGAKDLARTIFVGLADMHGFNSADVCNYLDMSYDSHRHKVQVFRDNLREARKRVDGGIINHIDDPVKKFYYKVCLCLNSIKNNFKENSYLKLQNYVELD